MDHPKVRGVSRSPLVLRCRVISPAHGRHRHQHPRCGQDKVPGTVAAAAGRIDELSFAGIPAQKTGCRPTSVFMLRGLPRDR